MNRPSDITFGLELISSITDKDINGGDASSAKPPRLAARAAFFDDENRLALMYIADWQLYMLPGGGLEEGEDAVAAAVRESLEETGCHVRITRGLGYIYENRGGYDFTQYSYYYLASIYGEREAQRLMPDETEHGTQLMWVGLDEAIRLTGSIVHTREQRRFIQRRELAALDFLKNNMEKRRP